MRSIGIRELKAQTSQVLREVRERKVEFRGHLRTGIATLANRAVRQLVQVRALHLVPTDRCLGLASARLAANLGLRGADAVYVATGAAPERAARHLGQRAAGKDRRSDHHKDAVNYHLYAPERDGIASRVTSR